MKILPFPSLILACALVSPLSAQGLDVAVLGADDPLAIADVEATLNADSRINSTTAIDIQGSTPSLATLLAYDTVIVWRTQPNVYFDAIGLGDVLAAYVAAGCGVVECMGAGSSSGNLLGNWQGTYNCTNPSGFLPFTGTYSMGTVINPGHPVMAGVTTFTTTANSYYVASPPVVWAQSIANYTGGEPLVMENLNTPLVIYLNFFPRSETFGTPGWALAGDGDLLIGNAVAHVGPAAPSGPTISVIGTCGVAGSSVFMSGATASSPVALMFGFGAGTDPIPGSAPACALTVTGLASPALATVTAADGAGDANFSVGGMIPAAACGVVTVQALDVPTCTVTNILAL